MLQECKALVLNPPMCSREHFVTPKNMETNECIAQDRHEAYKSNNATSSNLQLLIYAYFGSVEAKSNLM